jgi:hypothetical protein
MREMTVDTTDWKCCNCRQAPCVCRIEVIDADGPSADRGPMGVYVTTDGTRVRAHAAHAARRGWKAAT